MAEGGEGAAETGGTAGAGSDGGAAGVSGRAGSAGTSGTAGSGATAPIGGAAGTAGSAGAPPIYGQVSLRPDSYRAARGDTVVPVSPTIEGQDALLLAQVLNPAAATSSAEDLGFELVTTASIAESTPPLVIHVFWKLAAGPSGQPTKEAPQLTITNSLDAYQDLLLLAVHGHDPMTPVLATSTAGGDTAEMSVPGLTVMRPGSLGLWWKAGYGSGTERAPTGWTSIVRGQDGVNDIAWRNLTVGATGAVGAYQRSPSPWALVLAAVQPPPVP